MAYQAGKAVNVGDMFAQQNFITVCDQRLKSDLFSRCPMVAAQLWPLQGHADAEIRRIYACFLDYNHLDCKQHFTICLSQTICKLSCRYRALENMKSMNRALSQLIPGGTVDYLISPGAVARYHQSIKSSNTILPSHVDTY